MRNNRPLFAALLCAAVSTACGRPQPPRASVFLLDDARAAQVGGGFDFDELERRARAAARALFDGRFSSAEEGHAATLEARSLPSWRGPSPVVRAVWVPVNPSEMIECVLEPEDAGPILLFECPRLPDADALGALVLDLWNFRVPLPAGRPVRRRLDDDTQALLLLADGGRDPLLRLSVLPHGEAALIEALEPIDRTTPWRRRVHLARMAFDALVLGEGGEARFECTIPGPKPLLRMEAAVLGAPRPVLLQIEVRTGNDVAEVTATVLPRPLLETLPDIPIDPASAGRRATITLRASRLGQGFLAVASPRLCIERLADPRPDVVIVSLDTVRRDRLGLYGYDRPTSPHLDRFAPRALVFDRAYAPAPWTLPSHVSLLSGLWPDRHGVTGARGRIPDSLPWLPELLRRAGFRTIAATGGGYVGPAFGFARGFDLYGTVDPARPARGLADQAGATGRQRRAARRAEASRAHLLAEIERPVRPPLFAFVHTYVAHEYGASEEDLRAVGADGPMLERAKRPVDAQALLRRAEKAQAGAEGEALRREVALRYDAALREADRLVRDVVSALERAGTLERSVVVVLSDHGEELGEHGAFGHGHALHEELLRVPLLLRAPSVEAGRRSDPVSLVDVVPTIARLAGVVPSRGLDGRDLLAPIPKRPRPLLARGDRRSSVYHALLHGRFKLCVRRDADGTETVRLFDLASDPGERRDLSQERPRLARTLAETLAQWIERLESERSAGGEAALTPEVEAELRALGYLGDGS